MRTGKGIMKMIALILFSLCLVTVGYSQDSPFNTQDWNILKSISIGRQLQVKTKEGKSVIGILNNVTDTSLSLTAKVGSFSFGSSEVANVYVLRGRPIAKRTWMGAGVGTGGGALLGLISGRDLIGAFFGGGLGLVAGSVAGFAFGLSKEKELVYEANHACCLNSLAASRYEISVAYSLMRATNSGESVMLSPNGTYNITIQGNNHNYLGGYKIGMGFNLNRYLGIVGEFGWQHSQKAPLQISLSNVAGSSYCSPASDCVHQILSFGLTNSGSRGIYTLLAGPRISMNLSKRIRPFAHVLMGAGRNSLDMDHSYGVTESQGAWKARTIVGVRQPGGNSFAITYGGGLNIKTNKRLSIRLFEAEVVNAQDNNLLYNANTTTIQYSGARSTTLIKTDQINGSPDKKWGRNVRFSSGAVFHFGKKD
jgi:hypothetical protein